MAEVVEILVAGMTCDHCVGTVRRALEGVEGVRSASVDLARGRAEVTKEPELDVEVLCRVIEKAGYSVPRDGLKPSPTVVQIRPPVPAPLAPAREDEEWNLAIGGMHCASCVGRVEAALAGVPG